ncbi:MAG: GNAT family N-acetyltransferase [Polyangiales bacterium]
MSADDTGALAVASEAERASLGEILAHSFAFPASDAPAWFERAGHDNVLAWRECASLAGGLITIPMGQYFGGRSVPMVGVAGVGIAPEHRARGAATRMMRALVRSLRAQGVALSTLYPATVPLYQRAGYERAGGKWKTTVRPHDLPTRMDPALRVVSLDAVGAGETRALYDRQARLRDGALDRGSYQWTRVDAPFKRVVRRLGFAGDGGLEGYVVLSHTAPSMLETQVAVIDAVAVTPRAAEALLVTLGAYRSLATEVSWLGGPHDPLTQRLRERHHTVTLGDFWMTRVVDVPAALAARGYNPAITASVTLDVRDELVPDNEGRWRVEVSGGRAEVRRDANTPGVSLDVRALAPLYTGFRTAEALAWDGLAVGDPRDLAAATAIFSGSFPSLADHF